MTEEYYLTDAAKRLLGSSNEQYSVAVVLNLVNPALSGGRVRYERGNFQPIAAEGQVLSAHMRAM
jgi:hypothetical protein